MVSTLTMVIGIAAVLAAVIYRINRDGSNSEAPAEIALPAILPAGARIISSALDGDRLALTIEAAGATRVLVLDLSDGEVIQRVTLGQE